MTARQVKRSRTPHPARSYRLLQRARLHRTWSRARGAARSGSRVCAGAGAPACARVRAGARACAPVGVRGRVCVCVRACARACWRVCVRALACVTRDACMGVACGARRPYGLTRQFVRLACMAVRPSISAYFPSFRVIEGVRATANWRVCWCWRDWFALKSMKCRK